MSLLARAGICFMDKTPGSDLTRIPGQGSADPETSLK